MVPWLTSTKPEPSSWPTTDCSARFDCTGVASSAQLSSALIDRTGSLSPLSSAVGPRHFPPKRKPGCPHIPARETDAPREPHMPLNYAYCVLHPNAWESHVDSLLAALPDRPFEVRARARGDVVSDSDDAPRV